MWRSPVARLLWEQDAGGSNPSIPTMYKCIRCDQPIVGDDPHTDEETGEDCHEQHCTLCHPENFTWENDGYFDLPTLRT